MKIPTICRYCGGVIRLVPARKIYGASTDRLGLAGENIYLCQNCNARVGCQKMNVSWALLWTTNSRWRTVLELRKESK